MSDIIQAFSLRQLPILGRCAILHHSVDWIVTRADYPLPLAHLLAEATGLTATLAGLFKNPPFLTLQSMGTGAIKTLVTDMSRDMLLRGCIEWDKRQTANLMRRKKPATVADWLRGNYLSLTIDAHDSGSRYQGMIEATAQTLSECMVDYFKRSVQTPTLIQSWIIPPSAENMSWRSMCILLQQLPAHDSISNQNVSLDDWQRLKLFLDTLNISEWQNCQFDAPTILQRLFYEDGLVLHGQQKVHSGCRCSEEKMQAIVSQIPEAELSHYLKRGRVILDCQFCRTQYKIKPRPKH